MSSHNKLIRLLKEESKRILGKALTKIQDDLEPPVWIFSTRRSGSTLLMEAIATQPGMAFINQPLNYWDYDPFRSQFPQLYHQGRILEVDEDGILLQNFEKISRGDVWIDSQWNPFDPTFSFRVNRFVIKILNAKAIMDWFLSQFGGSVIYLVRHPVPVSLSVLRKGWGNSGSAFLSLGSFYRSKLPDGFYRECLEIFQKGSLLQKYLLEWVLENLIPLSNFREKQSWMLVTYEELVLRPSLIAEKLANYLGVPFPDRILNRIQKPSRSAGKISRQHMNQRGSAYLVRRWTDNINADEKLQAERVFSLTKDYLALDIYQVDSPYPSEEHCMFGKLR